MKKLIAASVLSLGLFSVPAFAAPIAPGGTLSGVTVTGKTSIYDIFGHPGDPGGDFEGGDSPAILTTFASGSNNVFTFSTTGLVSCCSDTANIPPDGGASSMNIVGANGLSGLSGDHNIPFVGVFTTNADPFGGVAPTSLSFTGATATSLSPLLNQVFYIGDGLSGFTNASGAPLQFTAPSTATRLYIGVIDADGFNAVTGYYADNNGSFTTNISLASVSTPGPVGAAPEPATWAMMILGFGLAGFALRRQRRSAAFA